MPFRLSGLAASMDSASDYLLLVFIIRIRGSAMWQVKQFIGQFLGLGVVQKGSQIGVKRPLLLDGVLKMFIPCIYFIIYTTFINGLVC